MLNLVSKVSRKGLRETVSDTLKYTSHVQKICDKANKVFHMIKRNVSRLLPNQQKLHLYKSMVLMVCVNVVRLGARLKST